MTEKFDIVHSGEALKEVQAPVTPRGIKHKGGDANPSVAALQAQFSGAVVRSQVVWGETTVYITPESVTDVMRWLHGARDCPHRSILCSRKLCPVHAMS